MNIQTQRESDITREKLQLLQQRYDAIRQQSDGVDHVQELTLRSLKGLINQLTEEIARFEGHSIARMSNA